ncbi:MAG TPA: hypothetical protein VI248_20575 [Kineosporiaceae bacterium]
MTSLLDNRLPPALPGSDIDGYGVSPVDPHRHSMGYGRLIEYLRIKVHHLVDERDWAGIVVLGRYDRTSVVSSREKNDKLFNWERPTARVDGARLVIECFPGRDYVLHYALLIATYLTMTGRYRGQVSYVPPEPEDCQAAVATLGGSFEHTDLVVVGWGLTHLCPTATWIPGRGHRLHQVDVEGRRVAYLGYQHSIWGDVAGRVVTRLAELGARRVVYLGKVGSLDPAVEPNTHLATGSRSVLVDGEVTWPDVFAGLHHAGGRVITGTHVTSPSILLEGQDWVARHRGRHFVDPEIGHMGRAARDAGIEFGYLHVISNNLTRAYPADLSNERLASVVQRRAALLTQIDAILRARLRQL